MIIRDTRGALAASALALSVLATGPALAQQGGSSGGVQGRDVNASTYGYGSTDQNSINVGGGGEAGAANGGTASTESSAKLNERRAMQRSTAVARDEDERARSRTRTVVRKDEEVRSRTTSVYKQQGEKPVRESSYTVNGVEQQKRR